MGMNTQIPFLIQLTASAMAAFAGVLSGCRPASDHTAGTDPDRYSLSSRKVSLVWLGSTSSFESREDLIIFDSRTGMAWRYDQTQSPDIAIEAWEPMGHTNILFPRREYDPKHPTPP